MRTKKKNKNRKDIKKKYRSEIRTTPNKYKIRRIEKENPAIWNGNNDREYQLIARKGTVR